MAVEYLLGVRRLGNETDWAKIRNYGFFYWISLPNTFTHDDIQVLNDLIFVSLQRVEIPDWPFMLAEQRTYSNIPLKQPVPSGIGNDSPITLRYLALLTLGEGDQVFDKAHKVFTKWIYEITVNQRRAWTVGEINPSKRTAAAIYVLLSPDLTEIWGGEVFNGVMIESYTPGFSYSAGNPTIREITVTFRFHERFPIYTVLNAESEGSLSKAFEPFLPSTAYIRTQLFNTIQKAKSLFTMET